MSTCNVSCSNRRRGIAPLILKLVAPAFLPQESVPVTTVQQFGWASRPAWTDVENRIDLVPEIRTQNLPAPCNISRPSPRLIDVVYGGCEFEF